MSDVAIAHEHYYERGGGERVAEAMAQTFDAPIYTGFVGEQIDPADVDAQLVDLFGSSLTRLLFDSDNPWRIAVRDFLYQFQWSRVDALYKYDTIVQSGNNPGWFVPREEQAVVKYVHSTPRNAFDLFTRTEQGIGSLLYAKATRQLYRETLPYPDLYLANSELVARRCRRYWGIDEDDLRVVYPPVDVETYGPDHARRERDYYLAFSRLTPEKGMDTIIRAFRTLDADLVIGGDGPERERLEQLAAGVDNVDLVGYMSEAEKRERLAEARACIFAATNEDFGIVPIEALASGTPVIGVRDGYTQYQIAEGETGYLYDHGAPELASAVRRFERDGVGFDADELQAVAEQYGRERFEDELRDAVAEARERASITPRRGRERVVADGGEGDD